MSQIDTAFVNGFHANFDLALQQMQSRLEPYVRVETQTGEYDYFDRIGSLEVTEVTTRWADTVNSEIAHDRRQSHIRDFDASVLIDQKDKLRMLQDPTSSYIQTLVAAHNRKKDDLIIQAAFATAKTGKAGGTDVAFPSGNTILVTGVLTGNSYGVPDPGTEGGDYNLTPGKLRTAKLILDRASEKLGGDGEPHILACDPIQIAALLSNTKATSSDYNTVRALMSGDIDTYMGFKFVRTTRLSASSGVRDCIAFVRSALMLSKKVDTTVRVTERPDKRYAVQAYTNSTMGAVRMWEEGVVKIQCKDSANLGAIS